MFVQVARHWQTHGTQAEEAGFHERIAPRELPGEALSPLENMVLQSVASL
jgi:hypothetical protein